MNRPGVLMQNFHANRTLTCNHIWVIKRMDERELFSFFQLNRMGVGIGEALACQNHFTTVTHHPFNFHLRRGFRHDNNRTSTQAFS